MKLINAKRQFVFTRKTIIKFVLSKLKKVIRNIFIMHNKYDEVTF